MCCREFIEQTRLFIPVYLDGDTPGAQKYGEKFQVQGYPTLIAFNSSAEEVTRIPGGLELERYAQVLQLVLNKIKPVKELVASVNDPSQKFSEQDFELLAYYSWGQDRQQALPADHASDVLFALFQRCPTALVEAKSRLFFAYLSRVQQEQEKNKSDELSEQQRTALRATLNSLLQSKQQVLANVTAIRYDDGNTVSFLTQTDSPERARLVENWLQALQVIARSDGVSSVERLGTLYAEVSLEKLQNDGEITSELRERIKSTITHARKNIKNKYEHSAIVNMSRNILVHAEMQDYAEQVIAEEIREAASPYYFMLELADFAQQEGRKEEALSWFERAYQESASGATRFQWGVHYLGGLTELVPEQEGLIEQLALELVAILAEAEDGFYNRNTTRLHEMEKKLMHWNETGQHSAVITNVRQALQQACEASIQSEQKDISCDDYLVTL